jgi:hypothetical protein
MGTLEAEGDGKGDAKALVRVKIKMSVKVRGGGNDGCMSSGNCKNGKDVGRSRGYVKSKSNTTGSLKI